MPSLTTEQFIQKAISKHGDKYNYSLVNYENSHRNINIICKRHGSFSQAPNTHLSGRGCPKCGRERTADGQRKTKETFVKQSIKRYGNLYDYSIVQYDNALKPVEIICKRHGSFLKAPAQHLYSGYGGCHKCLMEDGEAKYRKLSQKEFIRRAYLKHGNRYDYSKSVCKGYNKKITIICKTHGLFMATVGNHLAGKNCPICAAKDINKEKITSFSDFTEEANRVHKKKYKYDEQSYIKCYSPVKIFCDKHGWFNQLGSAHLGGCGCSQCNISKGEQKISDFLDNNKIKYEREKTFLDCRNPKTKHLLRFDFYLSYYNILIEYDGEQHFKAGTYYNKHKSTRQDLMGVKHKDRVKTLFAKNKKITLIRIKYTQFNKIEKILSEALKVSP